MSDKDLLIGGDKGVSAQPQGASGLATPMDFVNVSVFGVFKDSEKKEPFSSEEEYVEQKFAVQIPRGEPGENVAQYVWQTKFIMQACLRAVGSAGEINFYPLDRFKRFTMKVGSVVGVTL